MGKQEIYQKFIDLMDAAEEVFNNEDYRDLKTFYQKLNQICLDRRIDGTHFGGSWSNHVKRVKEEFERNGNRFTKKSHQRFAQLHQKIDAEYCTAPAKVAFQAICDKPSTSPQTKESTRTSAPTVSESRPSNDSIPLRSILKKTSATLPNNHHLNNYATVPFNSSYQPSAIRFPPFVQFIHPVSPPFALKVLPQSPGPSNLPVQSPSVSVSNGKNDTSLQQNDDDVLQNSNDDLQNASTKLETVNTAHELNCSDVTTTTPLASGETLAKKSRFESSPSLTPPSTVQQSELYAILANTEFYDVVVVASDGTQIPTQRSILSYYSPGFKHIFKNSNEFPVQIPMKDFDVDTIQAALDFMLFKPDSIVGKELALLKLALKYDVPKLMESCAVDADKLEITKSNVVEYVQIAYDYNLEKLKEKCLKVLAENKKEIDVAKSKLPYNILIDLINVL
uniref:BTB domain-containing protein n=1 Tax=Panagrolaimus sp. PS1159 TaxID=55785 RepID=A0AC35GLH5_9BILA